MKIEQEGISVGLESILLNNERVYFKNKIIKFNDFNRSQERTIVITSNAIYNIKKETKIKRRIPLDNLDGFTISNSSSEFLIHIKNEDDYRFLSFEYRSQIIDIILTLLNKFFPKIN